MSAPDARPRVLLTRRWPNAVERRIAARFEATLNPADEPLTAAELADAALRYDALCPTVTDAIDATVLGAAPRTKLIANYGVGFNNIDVETCQARGIAVTNTPDVLTEATAEIALTLMLMVARRAGEGERQVRAGAWTGWRPTHMLGAQLTGKTLGLVGFGRIAQATARKAHCGFGMPILYCSRRRASPEIEAETGAEYRGDLRTLLADADVVSLHCPGGVATRHLIDAAALGAMKASAFLINTARGTVVDEAALVEALRDGRIAGAGLDVYEDEPRLAPGLAALESVVLLPHLGSATVETRVAMGMRVADNLEAFFDGREPRDRVA